MANGKSKFKPALVKVRRTAEFNVRSTYSLHPDAVSALERMAAKFGKAYGEGAVRKQLVSFGIIHLEHQIEREQLKAGDDIEQELEI